LEKYLNPRHSAGPVIAPRLQPTGRGSLPCVAGWDAVWQPGPAEGAPHVAVTGARRACPRRGHRAWDAAVARSPVARWRLAGGKVLLEISRGPQGGVGHGGGGRGAPERWADGEAAQTASGGGVQRRRCRRGPVARGRPGGEEAAVD
jgi:hypothetical protein